MNFKMFHGYKVFDNGIILSKQTFNPLSQHANKGGYLRVTVWINGKMFNKTVHGLVAELFLPNYYGEPTVDHKDQNKLNNSLYNLKWETHRGQQLNQGMPSNNTSGNKGVYYDKGKNRWTATICKTPNKITRRTFKTKAAAIAQRLAWEKEFYDK